MSLIATTIQVGTTQIALTDVERDGPFAEPNATVVKVISLWSAHVLWQDIARILLDNGYDLDSLIERIRST